MKQMNLRKSVKVMCAQHDKSQVELASHLGFTNVWLSRQLEQNNPRHIRKIAMFFGVNVSDLIKAGEQ
jgi:hypothetical protein